MFITFVMILGISSASAQIFQKYKSREECVNRELLKYFFPTTVAYTAASNYCTELFLRIEIEKIKKCGAEYDDAIKAGYGHNEIVEFIRKEKPSCLQ